MCGEGGIVGVVCGRFESVIVEGRPGGRTTGFLVFVNFVAVEVIRLLRDALIGVRLVIVGRLEDHRRRVLIDGSPLLGVLDRNRCAISIPTAVQQAAALIDVDGDDAVGLVDDADDGNI